MEDQTEELNFSQTTTQTICTLINNVLSGDNTKIAYATKQLKTYIKHKSSIKTLTFILVNSNNTAQRQMTTILLKRNIVNLYMELQEHEQLQFRSLLLSQYAKQTSIAIQKGIATLISLLLPVIQIKNWGQLEKLLGQAINSAPNSAATLVLLNCLLDHFTPPKSVYNYLFAALQLPNLVDQALKCILAVSQTQEIDDSLAIQIIKIWQKCQWQQETSINCLQIFNVMIQRKVKLNDQIIEWICNHIVVNSKLSTKFRTAGIDLLTTYAEFNGKTLSNKQQLLKKIIETVCQVCSQPFGQQQVEEGQPVQQIALWLIQALSVHLKSKKIYPIMLQASTNLINSNDINKMNTGFLLLASISEGCTQRLRKNLQNPIMNILIPKGLNHSAPQVRGAAIQALSYFAQHLIPDIVEYHSTIIPSMMNSIDDLSKKVAQKALIAIDDFLDNMQQQQINKYLYIIIPKLSTVITNQKSTISMRNVAISAIASSIRAAGIKFQPFVQNLYNICIHILKMPPSPQVDSIRAENISLIAQISHVFCNKDYQHRQNFFKTFIFPVLDPTYQLLTTEKDPQIRNSCIYFFSRLANAIQNQFSTIFDKIIPQVIKSAELTFPHKKSKDFSLDSDSEDDNNYLTFIQTSQLSQKTTAICALGELASACPIKFIPYFEQAYRILDENYQHFYEDVRINVSGCYVNLIEGNIKCQYNGIIPEYKCGLPVLKRYPAAIQTRIKTQIIVKLIFMMTQDDNRRVISQAISSFNDLIDSLGPASIDQSIQQITSALIALLQSQKDQDDDDENQQNLPHQNQDDTDAYIFQPLCTDLIPTIAKVLAGAFLPSLSSIYPYMSQFLQERDNIDDNIQMTGSISQCIKYVPSFFENHAEQLFNNLTTLSKLMDSDLNRNIAYCFAEAIEKAPNFMKNYIELTMQTLKNIYDHKDSSQSCKDNVLAAFCRAIIVFNPPIPYQIFVQNLINSMPFKGDEQQQQTAIRCLIYLSESNQNLITPHIKSLTQILQNDLSEPKKYSLEGQLLLKTKKLLQALKNHQ